MGKQTTTWKHAERKTAALLGGERVGPTGRATADVITDWAAVEVKHRKTLPKWLKGAVGQAVAAAGPRQSPMAVLHEKGQRYTEALVVMRMCDFIDLHGEIMPEQSQGGKLQE